MRLVIVIALCYVVGIVNATDYSDFPIYCRIMDPDYCTFMEVFTTREKCQAVGFEVSCDTEGECSKISYEELERAYDCVRNLVIEERQKIVENDNSSTRDTQANIESVTLSLFDFFSTISMLFTVLFSVAAMLTMLKPFLSPSQILAYNEYFDVFVLLFAAYGFYLYFHMIYDMLFSN